MKKFLIVVVCVVTYLSVGWNLGTYYHNNIFTKHSSELTTFTQKTLTGMWVWKESIYKTLDTGGVQNTLRQDQISVSFAWPVVVSFPYLVWVFHQFKLGLDGLIEFLFE